MYQTPLFVYSSWKTQIQRVQDKHFENEIKHGLQHVYKYTLIQTSSLLTISQNFQCCPLISYLLLYFSYFVKIERGY